MSISPASLVPTEAALEKAGVSTFLHQGCDTLEVLTAAYDEV